MANIHIFIKHQSAPLLDLPAATMHCRQKGQSDKDYASSLFQYVLYVKHDIWKGSSANHRMNPDGYRSTHMYAKGQFRVLSSLDIQAFGM